MKYELKQCVRKVTLFNISQVSIHLIYKEEQDFLSQACLRPIGLLQIK